MGKVRPRAVEKGVLGHSYGAADRHPGRGDGSLTVPPAPVFYPTDDEFKDPLEYISKIRPQAEPYGICCIVPPKSWNPPFARDIETFPTKTQAIHRLQARPPSYDSATFELEYGRFLERHLGKKAKKKLMFYGSELNLCHLFNAVKRYGGYEKVCDQKRWGDVAQFMRSDRKISECSKHVLCQLYREHLFDYEEYLYKLNFENKKVKKCREKICHEKDKALNRKRRRRDSFEEMGEVSGGALDQICEQCNSGLHGDVMLLCDKCDKGWHLHCLSPPLDRVPSGNWYCLECLNSDKDSFGFVPGKQCLLDDFKRMNDRIRRKLFGQFKATRMQIEKLFWEIVEGKAGDLDVLYGSDIDTSIHGSGFPRARDQVLPTVEVDVWQHYVSSPWNLNNLPKLQGSMLRVVHDNIAGVMVPWLYVGMLFSSFCWHVEDHCFYSINYLHWGDPKCWYGVPGREASAFEQVMRNTLPDLFDAQPDLLFQLVTMLNPSVLRDNGIPVYSVMQEPGNFVITFPKSFHAGFNFGLNCAEAVNFAPADWLPHGRFGAELYCMYRKAAILSHEELLCVFAKSTCDGKALPHLKEELYRIYISEKSTREELWKNGVFRSCMMAAKKNPMYVGTEEDHTCIICQQYLYLSAVSCSCRATTFVCLKHWKHLCECDSSQHRLLYRYSLAELDDLISMTPSISHMTSLKNPYLKNSRQNIFSPQSSITIIKKVKNGQVTFVELAEDWLSKACNLLEIPFSNNAYAAMLNEAEQFLWAGHDMDPVRHVFSKLIDAQKWALSVKDCLFRLESCFSLRSDKVDKVSLNQIEEILSIDPIPCCEPGFLKLKGYADVARKLVSKITKALSSCLDIEKLEVILSKAMEFPIDVEETKILSSKISSAKIWLNNVQAFFFKERPRAIDILSLNRLKTQMAELHVQFPEMDLLANFCREVELLHSRCKEILTCPLKLKFMELDSLLKDADKVRVCIPELDLLRHFHSDACSWRHDFYNILGNLPNREDHENVVAELSGILKSGRSLRIEVDELQLVEAELERSCCREKAVKVLQVRMPLEFIQEVLMKASLLDIRNEKLFLRLSEVDAEAVLWEKRANFVLTNGGSMADFEDVLRASEHVFTILPSLSDLKGTISMAQTWICRSQLYLTCNRRAEDKLSPVLGIEDLEELVTLSKCLKVNLPGSERLEMTLNDIYEWEHKTCLLVEETASFLEDASSFTTVNDIILRTEELLSRANSATKSGISLCVVLSELPKLQRATLTLQWILSGLSFCTRIPLAKDVDNLLEDVRSLPSVFAGSNLVQMLLKGAAWLRKGLNTLFDPQNSKRCTLKEVEDVLGELRKTVVQYPVMVAHLQNSIEKHKSWIFNVHELFSQPRSKRWASLVELEGQGHSNAFDCPELAIVTHEVGEVRRWMFQCQDYVRPLVGNLGTLSMELIKIKETFHKALSICRSLNGSETKTVCVCCPNDSEKHSACMTCEDRYHFSCMGLSLALEFNDNNICPFCFYMKSGVGAQNGEKALFCRGNLPELKSFVKLVSAAEDFYPGIEEVTLGQEIVKLASECQSNLSWVVDHANTHYKDFNVVSEYLVCALKVTLVAGLYDHDGCHKLQTALSRHAWNVRVKTLLSGAKKTTMQHVKHIEKEGLEMGITHQDHFMLEIAKVKQACLQWLDSTKKAVSDLGELALSRVFELMIEGESLPVHFDEEMKLLRTRSILYCICRKPDDRRPMIACDHCDEWYHFDCLKLHEAPRKAFLCPACKPLNGKLVSFPRPVYHEERTRNDGEPQTPACHESKRRKQTGKFGSCLEGEIVDAVDKDSNFLKCYSEIDHLWRMKRRPLQRASRKHGNLGSFYQLLPFSASNQMS
ncbi:lysine-specific demethylase 5B [Phalaenopsis equestris]|uniref:lysine-specific demethylase 5B n=1 Tax=Phalaenopsis equestris TaxID=78828 RepID=UPI0009E4C6DD|nr:lysine-specific demethylase 5B [Phalaenopsis equestris]